MGQAEGMKIVWSAVWAALGFAAAIVIGWLKR